jgi:hypothetical protein
MWPGPVFGNSRWPRTSAGPVGVRCSRMNRRALIAGSFAVACSLGLTTSLRVRPVGAADRTASASAVTAPRMEKTAAYILGYCRKSQLLPLACPHRLPFIAQPPPHWETGVCLVGAAGCGGLTWDDLSLVDAGNGVRPPVWSHISIYAGNLASAFGFRYPTQGKRVAHLDGLFAKTRARAIFLGSYTWGGKQGTVVLAPAYPGGGETGATILSSAGTDHTLASLWGSTAGNRLARRSQPSGRWFGRSRRSGQSNVLCAGVHV